MTEPLAVWTDEHNRLLSWLLVGGDAGLNGGAELEVSHADGSAAFRAALARHHRVEPPDLVWIRPVVGGYGLGDDELEHKNPGGAARAFDVDVARRRALHLRTARAEGHELHLELATGQTAVIRPAAPDTLAELSRWDTWYYTALDAADQRELDGLDHDP